MNAGEEYISIAQMASQVIASNPEIVSSIAKKLAEAYAKEPSIIFETISIENSMFGNDIMHSTGFHSSDGYNRSMRRIDLTRNKGLHIHHQITGNDHGVNCLMRPCSMPTASVNSNGEGIGIGADESLINGYPSNRIMGIYMAGKDHINP